MDQNVVILIYLVVESLYFKIKTVMLESI